MKKFILIFTSYLALGLSSLLAQNQDCACCKTEFQQFAFWEGNWDVFGQDGTQIGTNRVVFLQDKCVLQENWKGLSPNDAGTSYNFYNTEKKVWQQVWVSSKGRVAELKGNFINNTMVLKSDLVKNPYGNMVINKITWKKQENGEVIQIWETSSDNEKTWKTAFYGIYRKSKTN